MAAWDSWDELLPSGHRIGFNSVLIPTEILRLDTGINDIFHLIVIVYVVRLTENWLQDSLWKPKLQSSRLQNETVFVCNSHIPSCVLKISCRLFIILNTRQMLYK